jgi:hypothetical protein
VDAAWLGLVRDLDARPEAVAGAQAGRVAATFLTHRLHVASGQVSRAHLDVAVRAVRRIPQRLLAGVDPDGQSGARGSMRT